ncbi:MAG: hypothetical protein AABY47_05890, partial [Pseudomonadota bacterium]
MSEDNFQKQTTHLNKNSLDKVPEHGRRRLLKSTVAIPVVMTLYSGAALARTSNLVSPITDLSSAAKGGTSEDLLCVH